MGKKSYTRSDVSKIKTDALGINTLLVLDSESSGTSFHAVSEDYFRKQKHTCPACLSNKTRSSKVTTRVFKDIIESKDGFQIVDLFFHQRWFRCDNCKTSVFPEIIDFAEKGSRYTNRLADKLAEGTFRYSYKKVCEYYGVPASKASVGAIMRRRVASMEATLPMLNTPPIIVVIEFDYFKCRYALIIGVYESQIYCLDILPDTSEATYTAFFRSLDVEKICGIFVEPNEELLSASATCFPLLQPALSQEGIERHIRNAFLRIIRSDGKRFPVVRKEHVLTQHKKYIVNKREKKQINLGMSSRERLSRAYDLYQSLLEITYNDWKYPNLKSWSKSIDQDLTEFFEIVDIIEFYEAEIEEGQFQNNNLPENFIAVITGINEVITAMPFCIFDVLKARCMLTIESDIISVNGEKKRLGIPADKFIKNINEITQNIKKEQTYEL